MYIYFVSNASDKKQYYVGIEQEKPLVVVLNEHLSQFQEWKRGKGSWRASFSLIDHNREESLEIRFIEEVDENNKDARFKYYLNQQDCINTRFIQCDCFRDVNKADFNQHLNSAEHKSRIDRMRTRWVLPI
jgi:hypothetical protein